MICPYCTTEIQPIELNGKTFCSNCGLAISQATIITHSQRITPLSNPNSDIHIKEESSVAPACNPTSTPQITMKRIEPTITELIKPTSAVLVESEPISNPETYENETEKPILTEPKINQELQAPAEEPVIKEKLEIAEPTIETVTPVSAVIPEEKPVKVLLDILDDKSEIRTLEGDSLKPKMDNPFNETVKTIDTLGASGILLDILSDEAGQKAKEDQKDILEAASNIIDKVKPAKVNEVVETETPTQVHVPKGGLKIAINVLDDSPVNPIKHLELGAAPAELDLPLPEKTLAESTDVKEAELQTEEIVHSDKPMTPEVIIEEEELEVPKGELIDNMEIEDIVNAAAFSEDKVEIAEQPVVVTEPEELTKLDDKMDNFFNREDDKTERDLDLSDLPSVKENNKKNKAHILNEAETIVEEANDNIKVEKPKVGLSADKSAHLTNYFSQIMVQDHNKVQKGKKKKKKKKISKSYFILYIFLLSLVLTASGFLVFLYIENNKPISNIEARSDENQYLAQFLPKEVPVGYILKNDAKMDEESQTLTATYIFSGNDERQIHFLRKKMNEPEGEVESNKINYGKKYEIKSFDEIEYTIFEDGSIIWSENYYYYSLTIKGETFKELVVKMATSTE